MEFFLEREEGREREKHRFAVPLIYAFIGWFLYVPSVGIEPTILAYRNNTLTKLSGKGKSPLIFNQRYGWGKIF